MINPTKNSFNGKGFKNQSDSEEIKLFREKLSMKNSDIE